MKREASERKEQNAKAEAEIKITLLDIILKTKLSKEDWHSRFIDTVEKYKASKKLISALSDSIRRGQTSYDIISNYHLPILLYLKEEYDAEIVERQEILEPSYEEIYTLISKSF